MSGGTTTGDGRVIAVLGNKIDNLSKQVVGLSTDVKDINAKTDERLRNVEKQTALLEQSSKTICKKLEKQDDEIKKINLVSKIIGGIAGGLAVAAAALGISR